MKFFRLSRLTNFIPRFAGAWSKPYLSALALLFLSFMAGFYLFFPTAALKGRIEQEFAARTSVELHMGKLSLLFPPGLHGCQISLHPDSDSPYWQSLEIADFVVKPLWHTLLTGDPGLNFYAELQGGRVEGAVRRNGTVETQLSQISFAAPLASESSLMIKGTLSQGGFSSIFPLKPGTESYLNLTLDKVELTGLEAIGVQKDILSLGIVSLEGRGKGNSFRIHGLKATGGNLEISGEGSFLLTNPFEKSRFNLQLVLLPAGGFDDKLNDLLNLFAKPGRNGSYLLRVNGTLANPRSF